MSRSRYVFLSEDLGEFLMESDKHISWSADWLTCDLMRLQVRKYLSNDLPQRWGGNGLAVVLLLHSTGEVKCPASVWAWAVFTVEICAENWRQKQFHNIEPHVYIWRNLSFDCRTSTLSRPQSNTGLQHSSAQIRLMAHTQICDITACLSDEWLVVLLDWRQIWTLNVSEKWRSALYILKVDYKKSGDQSLKN